MRRTTGNLALAGFDAIFNLDKTAADGECVVHIPLSELHPPEFHPFMVNDDLAMERLARSVNQHGVREPGLARPLMSGGYELVAGNRRKRACELAELATMPVIVRDMDDDTAAIAMVDSNLEQREKLLYSEKAWAYRVKLEALNHSGIKGDCLSVDVLVEQTGESKSTIFRLIRLTELIIGLLDKVDTRQLAFSPAVELSYLSQTEQSAVVEAMAKYEVKPSLSQAVRLRNLKKDGILTLAGIDKILAEVKKSPKAVPTDVARFRKYFPSDYSETQINAVIDGLLKDWQSRASA